MTRKKVSSLKPTSKADWTLLLIVLFLLISGIIFVFDASIAESFYQFNDKYHFARSQILWALIGVVALMISARIPMKWLIKASRPFYIISMLLLVAVIIPGIGVEVQGARRWLYFGSQGIQPSEMIKLASILYFPSWLMKKVELKPFIAITTSILLLLMLEPDLGTTIIVASIAFTIFYIAGAPIKQILSILVIGAMVGTLLIVSSPYRRARLTTFINPTNDPLGSSYHIRQVLIGLGSGGVFGTGFGRSRQKFQFLPEAATDSIFAVIAEETGFIGAIVIISAFGFFAIRGFKILQLIKESYPRLLATGALAWILTQTMLNLGAMVSLIPLTGVPLPFISYGGSSLVTILTAAGLLLNASRYRTIRAR